VPDAGEILQRIATDKEENLRRSDDDLEILEAYLKTQRVPQAVIEALEGLTVELASISPPLPRFLAMARSGWSRSMSTHRRPQKTGNAQV
jgi:hypothetical protein